jgi:hypothetical protein
MMYEVMLISIIHLKETQWSAARHLSFSNELAEQNINDYIVWDGIRDVNTIRAISRSHKQIVHYAKDHKLKEVCIMEDDTIFLGNGAFDYFISHKPRSFDLYLATASNVLRREGGMIKDFRGLLLYIIHENFYDTFLSVDEHVHIDVAMKDKGDYYICPKVVAAEKSGWSYNKKRVVNRRHLINQFEKYDEQNDFV